MRIAPLFAALLLSACSQPDSSSSSSQTTGSTSGTVSLTMDGTTTQIEEVTNSSWTSLTLNLELGTTAHDVYLAFINPGTAAATAPTVSASTSVTSSLSTASEETDETELPLRLGDAPFHQLPVPARTSAAVAQSLKLSASTSLSATSAPTASYTVGSTRTYLYFSYNGSGYVTKNGTATLVAQNTNATQSRIVNVWSLPTTSSWTTGASTAQAQALADRFLVASGTGEDIYSWNTGIFGREYYEPGTSVAVDLIAPTGEIDIVLCDLNQNNSSGSSVQGYFYAVDEFQSSLAGYEDSNERLAFYVDGPTFTDTTGTWSISDDGPATILSTLAHEFQHMIHYYQKTLAQNLSGETDTWINEMASMMAEDLVADKMLVAGPRGVPLSGGTFDYSTGSLSTNLTYDRLGYFNRVYAGYGLTAWSDVGSYSMAYSFGSWLARNYGGPELFRQIVQNSSLDENAVVNAVNAVNGTSLTFRQLLQHWAGAILASDSEVAAPVALQTGSPYTFGFDQTSAVTGTTQSFALGSIDYFKYYAYGKTTAGPVMTSSHSTIPAAGLVFKKALSGVSGTQSVTLSLPSTVDVAVVTKVTP